MSTESARPAIKFCGLTRAEDALAAAELGASYVGVIFAGGPRLLTENRAAEVLADVPRDVGRVGVFGDQAPAEIARIARRLSLRAVQLHGTLDPARVAEIRAAVDAEVWPVIRVSGGELPAGAMWIISDSNILFFDSYVPNSPGGSGVPFDWNALATTVRWLREGKRVILAGGLRATNLPQAIAALAPDVVDVSSGVESAPGIKDHNQMRLFRDAAGPAGK
ncbi:MAG TPA: phosphoribosylanthranilate isomerase [Gemmatimonadaceae bacterium]|nr:phosphoribosylanthranilate isomerase [Gemmatimonadaceae bacterium]